MILVMVAGEASQKGASDIGRRFIRVGYPAPRQLILDKGKDFIEIYQRAKGEL